MDKKGRVLVEFTGERVVHNAMKSDDPKRQAQLTRVLTEHLVRYNWAKPYCKGKSVLDAASGTGYGTKILGEVASSAVGVDVDPESVALSGEGFKVCDLERGFPDGEYDVIVSFETIEHLADPRLFLENCAKHGRQFIFSIPLNNPSEFHKVTYTLSEAQELIGFHFGNILWYEQTFEEIEPLTRESRFLIGVAT